MYSYLLPKKVIEEIIWEGNADKGNDISAWPLTAVAAESVSVPAVAEVLSDSKSQMEADDEHLTQTHLAEVKAIYIQYVPKRRNAFLKLI
jgi:hypothetical protein